MVDLLSSAYSWEAGGFPLGRMVASLLIVLLALATRSVMKSALKRVGARMPGFTGALARDLIRPASFLLIMLGVYISISIHDLSPSIEDLVRKVFLFFLTVNLLWLLMRVVDAVAEQMSSVVDGTRSRMDDQLIPILRKLAKFLLIAIGIIFYMQSNGYPVSGILAGMGIGGLAMALAAQDSIAGIFASVVIFLDKPFMVEDFVEVNGVTGTVEEIGIRSTRIRTAEKTLVTLPNKEIMDSSINNFSRRPMRRAETTVGVTYDTTSDKMRNLLARLREMLDGDEMVDSGTVFVNFAGFGDSSLDIEMKYFITSADYRVWLERRELINLKIMDIVQDLGLSFAFPSTTVYLEK
ncbi:MAG: mechanosensitive ion channel family protein [Candidatus Fermentibacteraceae bacterium]|nr:mechanosensitive ion channel family protein [Candidatus Fermentibacteraceae bacterium]MBN2608766.1 mechanosensitive ion channel family protein [Candidatus Fermentibacteraceae bacterium]